MMKKNHPVHHSKSQRPIYASFILYNSSFTIISSLLFGLLFACITPPFQSPDEPNHFFRAWQVSEGHLWPEKTGNRLGGVLPSSLSQVRDSFYYLKNNREGRLTVHTWRQGLAIPLRPEHRQFTDFANTAIYAPTAYLPQAAAIAALRPLGATPLQLLYGARLANLFVWIVLVWAALRLIPFMRRTLAVLALLPATLCIAASANADVLTNGLCWWLIAALLSASTSPDFRKKLLVVAMVAINKIVAAPLVLAGLFAPGSGSRWRQIMFLFLAGSLAAVLWGRMAQSWFIPYDVYDPAFRDTQTLNSGVDPARQMAFMWQHPVFFAKTCCTSLVQALPSMAAHFVGKFGWEKNYLPAGWMVLLWLLLAALLFSEKNPLTTRQRWGMSAVATCYVIVFAVTMYALWTAVGAEKLDNWQGRYFLPVAPVVMLAVSQGWLARWKLQIDCVALIVLITGNMAMAWSIWQRYWDF